MESGERTRSNNQEPTHTSPPPGDPSKMEPIVDASGHADTHLDCEGNPFTYEPEKTVDGKDKTAWRVPWNSEDEWIQLDYTRPVAVSAIGIIPGHDKIDATCEPDIDRFYQLYVVRRVVITFSDENKTVKDAQFDHDRRLQFVRLDSPITTKSVRIEIIDAYPPTSDQEPVHEIAISEIEVRR